MSIDEFKKHLILTKIHLMDRIEEYENNPSIPSEKRKERADDLKRKLNNIQNQLDKLFS